MNNKILLLFFAILFFTAQLRASEGDAERGKLVFQQCSVCHMLGKEAGNKIGPHLNNIVGSSAASRDDFEYSEAFRNAASAGLIWDESRLNQFIESPKSIIPNSKMVFSGLSEAGDRLDVIAYLKSFNKESIQTSPTSGFSVPDEVLAIQGDLEYGEYLASECSTCHHKEENTVGIPYIFGLSADDFVISMHAYREKVRENQVMQLIAGRLSNEEIASLAEYFKSLQ